MRYDTKGMDARLVTPQASFCVATLRDGHALRAWRCCSPLIWNTSSPKHVCPLCGGQNACAQAGNGNFEMPCWCREVSFDPVVLAQVPEERRNVTCICKRCAVVSTHHG